MNREHLKGLALAYKDGVPNSHLFLADALEEEGFPYLGAMHFKEQVGGCCRPGGGCWVVEAILGYALRNPKLPPAIKFEDMFTPDVEAHAKAQVEKRRS